MTEVYQYVLSIGTVWKRIFHDTRVHARAHLRFDAVLKLRFVVPYGSLIWACARLHVRYIVQEIDAFQCGEWHLWNQAVSRSAACTAFMKHRDGGYVAVWCVSTVCSERDVPSLSPEISIYWSRFCNGG